MHRKSTPLVEHSSLTPVKRWNELPVEQPGPTPGSETESTIEHSSSTPTKCTELNLEVLEGAYGAPVEYEDSEQGDAGSREATSCMLYMWPRGYGCLLYTSPSPRD